MKRITGIFFACACCLVLSMFALGGLGASAEGLSQDSSLEEARYTKREYLKLEYQIIYDEIYENVSVLEEDYAPGTLLFDFSDEEIYLKASNGDTIYIPIGSVMDDHPELEWISPGALEAVTDADTGRLTGIRLRSGMTNARIDPYQDKGVFEAEMADMNAVIDEILKGAEVYSSDYGKLKYIHDWLVTNNVYNSYVAAGQDSMADVRTWSAVSAFLSGNDPETGPVCEGYSEAFKVLCDRLGFPCVLLVGMNHQWNAVLVDGKWYGVDCTWDDPTSGGLDYISYEYFLVGTETKTMGGYSTFGKDHTAANSNIPEINEKGLAYITAEAPESLEYDGKAHGFSGEAAAEHGDKRINGEFAVSYYSADGGESLGAAAPVNAGKYLVRIELVDSEYEAYREFTYEINPIELGKSDICIDLSENAVYSGAAVVKKAEVSHGGKTLSEGEDYTVAYKNNINAGTAEMTVSGTGNYRGSKTVSFVISPAEMSGASVANIVDFEYDGERKEQSPAVTFNGIVLTEGTDYSVSYEGDCLSIGTSYVVIKGEGNFTGETRAAFKITEAPQTGRLPETPQTGENSSSPVPQTGDSQNMIVWALVLFVSLTAAAGCAVVRKRNR